MPSKATPEQPSPDPRAERVVRLAARVLQAPAAAFWVSGADGPHLAAGHGLAGLAVPDVPALEVPVIDPDGRRLGVLAVLDPAPRAWTAADAEMLADHAALLGHFAEPSSDALLRLLAAATVQSQAGMMIAEAATVEGPGSRIVYVNDAFARPLGYGAGELTGRSPGFLQASRTDRDALRGIAEALARGGTATAEVVHSRKDGSEIPARITLSPLRDERGTLTHVVTTQLHDAEQVRDADLAERARLEARVAERTEELRVANERLARELVEHRRADERYRALVRNFPDGAVGLLDRDLRFTLADGPELVRRGASLVGKTLCEVLDAPTAALIEPLFREALEGRSASVEVPTAGMTYLIRALPLRGDDGSVTAVMGMAQDITPRVAVVAALRESEARYRQLFANAGEAIYILQADGDAAGAILEANEAAAAMHGYTIDELLQRTQMDLDDPEVADGTPANIRRIGHGEWIEGESLHVRKGGARFPVEFSAGPLDVGDRRFILKFTRDVTERKRAEEALRQAKRAADAASRAKSAFLANMSHEIRTPMNAILGYTQLLQRDPGVGRDQQLQLEVIRRSGEQLLGLINDVLEMSKIEVGYRKLNRDDLDLGRMLDDLERTFRARAEAKRLAFSFARAPELPRHVIADGAKLRQVLVNLLGNAVKFTKEGSVSARVFLRPGDARGTRMVVDVEDTGAGIGANALDELFRPFAQARVGIQAQGGTGLGLAISREFARMMGGDITVESRLGQGSLFRVELPIEIGRAPSSEPSPPRGRVVGMVGAQGRVRVLLVDAHRDDQSWVIRLLEQVGFEVRAVDTGAEAVAHVDEQRPLLILLDVHQPLPEACAAVRALRAQPAGRRAAIVALTSSVFDEEHADLTAAGADGILRKPCREDDLLEEIRKQLGVEYAYAEPPPERTSPIPAFLAMRHEHVRALPAPVIDELRAAAHVADYDRLKDLVAKLQDQHAAVAEALRELVDQYAYEQIEAILAG